MSVWNHAICERCWYKQHPDRDPVRVIDHEPTECCFCAGRTVAGIFVRADPDTVKCRGRFGDHDDHEKKDD